MKTWNEALTWENSATKDMERLAKELWNNASDEFKACMAAGVPMASEVVGGQFTIKTAVKVGFVRDNLGRIIRVITAEHK